MVNSSNLAIGIDIGGTGIKGALIDLSTGELAGKRRRVPTPEGAAPDDVVEATRHVVDEIRSKDAKHHGDGIPVGVTFPAVVKHGVTWSASNVSEKWIGYPAAEAFGRALGEQAAVVNDADAAGVGELHYGAAKGHAGAVLVITLGTGIGSALLYDGRLFPNTEFGHIELNGHRPYERFASSKVRDRLELTWEEWAGRLNPYFEILERIVTPELIVISGGVSKEAAEFLPLLHTQAPVVAATLKNNAGIVGAARLARDAWS